MSRSRQSQVDVVGLTTEVTENVLATLRGELSNERDAFRETQERERVALRETFQEQTQQFLNTLENRTQGDQAGAASAQQRANDRIDSLQAQLQEERIHHERRGEIFQANARELAAPLVIPHHNGMRREAQFGMIAFRHVIEDAEAAIALLNGGLEDIPPHIVKAINKLKSVQSYSRKHRFNYEAMVCFIEETDAINDPRDLAISLRGRGTTECRLRLNELTSHNEEDMKAFKAWVRDFVKSSLKSCDSAKLLQAQNAKLRQPHRRFEAQQGANKKHKGNNNKSQQASAASGIGPEVLDDQE